MRQSLRILGALALVSLLGCNGAPTTPPPVQDVTGFWTGTITQMNREPQGIRMGTSTLIEVELVLTEDMARRITGVGAFFPRQTQTGPGFGLGGTTQGTSRVFEIGGTNSFPTVVFALQSGTAAQTTELVYLRGEFTAVDQVSGRLVGGGFNDDQIRLQRVPRLPPRP